MILLKYHGAKLKATVMAMAHCMDLMGLHPETVLVITPLYKLTAPTK